MSLPTRYDLFNPLLESLHQLGGSARVAELNRKVSELLKLPESDLPGSQEQSLSNLSHQIARARTHLKRHGLVDNPTRGTWTLTAEGEKTRQLVKWEVWRTRSCAG
jgi:restriction endonuclease Mrr